MQLLKQQENMLCMSTENATYNNHFILKYLQKQEWTFGIHPIFSIDQGRA